MKKLSTRLIKVLGQLGAIVLPLTFFDDSGYILDKCHGGSWILRQAEVTLDDEFEKTLARLN